MEQITILATAVEHLDITSVFNITAGKHVLNILHCVWKK